jgi:hypothetical protein
LKGIIIGMSKIRVRMGETEGSSMLATRIISVSMQETRQVDSRAGGMVMKAESEKTREAEGTGEWKNRMRMVTTQKLRGEDGLRRGKKRGNLRKIKLRGG